MGVGVLVVLLVAAVAAATRKSSHSRSVGHSLTHVSSDACNHSGDDEPTDSGVPQHTQELVPLMEITATH